MAVNYTLIELEDALLNHPLGLTEDELWEVCQYYTDLWESNVKGYDIQPLDDLVDEFLCWLCDNEVIGFTNYDDFMKYRKERGDTV